MKVEYLCVAFTEAFQGSHLIPFCILAHSIQKKSMSVV